MAPMSYVYVLTNEAMPGYVKIGMTERPVKDRVLELDNTSVPLPFQCYYAARVDDHKKIEKALHIAFGESRVRGTREFFTVDAFRVKAILDVIALEDVTPREDILENKEDATAIEKAIRHNRKFSFASAGIPIGVVLTLTKDESVNCVVKSDSTVFFQDKEMSVSGSALLALQQLGYKWSAVAGTEYWLYSGETLLSLRSAREAQTN
jgi:hypothetical protein